MNYDYDIRETFDANLGKDSLWNINNEISDYDILRLAVEFLRLSASRLDSDLKDAKINEEYIKLKFIIEQLENIIKNYV